MSPGQGDAAAGNYYLPILFRNISTRSCQLFGYPGVAGLDTAGQQVVQAIRSNIGGVSPHNVTLAPGQVGSAVIHSSNVPSGNQTTCPNYGLLVTPPGETHSVRLSISLSSCQRLGVGPVVPGTTGTTNG